MHNCGICGKSSKPKETAVRVVTETRPKTYEQPVNHSRRRNPLSFREVVREVLACGKCGNDVTIVKKIGNVDILINDLILFQGVKHGTA